MSLGDLKRKFSKNKEDSYIWQGMLFSSWSLPLWLFDFFDYLKYSTWGKPFFRFRKPSRSLWCDCVTKRWSISLYYTNRFVGHPSVVSWSEVLSSICHTWNATSSYQPSENNKEKRGQSPHRSHRLCFINANLISFLIGLSLWSSVFNFLSSKISRRIDIPETVIKYMSWLMDPFWVLAIKHTSKSFIELTKNLRHESPSHILRHNQTSIFFLLQESMSTYFMSQSPSPVDMEMLGMS